MSSHHTEISTWTYIRNHKREVFADKTLWFFIFVCMVVTIAQLVVGVMTESLGAYADCLHRMEHILSFIIVCIGRVLDKRGKDQAYSYGYGRHEYLLVFTLHLSIIIVSCFLLFEMVHGLSDGHHLDTDISPSLIRLSDYLSLVSFILSLICIFGFTHYKQQYRRRYSRDIFQASRKYKQAYNAMYCIGLFVEAKHMKVMESEDYMHILIDLITLSLIVLTNYFHIKKGNEISDLVECGVMCLFMIYTSWSDVANSAQVLVLGVPDDLAQEIRTLTRRTSMLDGVVEVASVHYWIESPGCLIGMMNVITHRNVESEKIIKTVQAMGSNTFQQLTVEVRKDHSMEWMDKE